jgi:hypothetical protein
MDQDSYVQNLEKLRGFLHTNELSDNLLETLVSLSHFPTLSEKDLKDGVNKYLNEN